MKKTFFFALAILFFVSVNASQVVKQYKLDNGLTVILSPDASSPDIFGMVVTKAGSYHEPSEATGLAHYLEHVLFKGTRELGTSNWESEKEIYEKIIDLFEKQRLENDEGLKESISKEINELSLEAGKFTISNEFSNLVQGIGGTNLNAGTSYDYTMYYNAFPTFQLERWLELYAHRFVNPVFRGFQAELENVYEEKNMYEDSPFSVLQREFMKNLYGLEHPYGRPLIGTTEHLKNPSLKMLIEYYNTFYVSGNMALVLTGNFNLEDAQILINKTFGKWDKKESPQEKTFAPKNISGEQVVKIKSTPLPVGLWAYKTVSKSHEDDIALEIMASILSNENETGLLDKLVLDGDILAIEAINNPMKYDGSLVIQAIPTFSTERMRYNSISSLENLINPELKKLKEGNFEDWLLESIKKEMLMEFALMQESSRSKAMLLAQLFVHDEKLDYLDNYQKLVMAVSKEKVKQLANKYIGNDYLKFYSLEGTVSKEKIKKPELKAIVPSQGEKSKFAEHLQKIPMGELQEDYIDFDTEITQNELAPGVKLFYTQNSKNPIFSLTIKFGAGEHKIPSIGIATELMNSAGILAYLKSHEVKESFSKLGCSYSFSANESYTYITLYGNESNLSDACKLLTRLYLMPEINEKQMDRLIGSELGNRYIENKQKSEQFYALVNFAIHGKDSPFLLRTSSNDVRNLTLSSLAAQFIEATHHETSVHYCGQLPFNDLKTILSQSLAFPSGLKPSDSPYIRPLTSPDQRKIYFINDTEATQSNILIYIKGDKFELSNKPSIDAYNQYFSGGFNGLVMQELRELRSFAYSASARYIAPDLENFNGYFVGEIGTQADKTVDALQEFLNLIDNMPEKPERMENIKNYLVQASLSSKPSFRNMSQVIENWQKQGYNTDPAKILTPQYKKLSFNDIQNFYSDKIKGQDLIVAIIGNKKMIDMVALEKIAKIETISSSKIYNE